MDVTENRGLAGWICCSVPIVVGSVLFEAFESSALKLVSLALPDSATAADTGEEIELCVAAGKVSLEIADEA